MQLVYLVKLFLPLIIIIKFTIPIPWPDSKISQEVCEAGVLIDLQSYNHQSTSQSRS